MQPGFSTVPMGGQPWYGQPGQYGQPTTRNMVHMDRVNNQKGYGGAQPVYKQISVCQGIDMNEYNQIVEYCKQAYMSRATPLSEHCTNAIKQRLGGDWFVFQCEMGNSDFDFHLTKVKGGTIWHFLWIIKKLKYAVSNKLILVAIGKKNNYY